MTIKEILCIIVAYLLGGVSTGYYLVRLRTGQDIREHGSGGVGARNVGRMLGKSGFVFTLLGDSLKGLLAVLLARHFDLPESIVSLAVLVVIAGHIWPAPLGFRGGRGIATAIGAYIAFDYHLALALLGITVLLMVFRRGFILSGLGAFLLLPVVAYMLGQPRHSVASLAAASAIILFAHRERIRNEFQEALHTREA